MKVITIDDENYPYRLKECVDAPFILYQMGEAKLSTPRMISIVGTRKSTHYGNSICENLVHALKPYQVTIVSGLAYGIDVTAHQACLTSQTPTIGVLGHGLDRIYPSAHRSIAKAMLNNGALLTEFLSKTIPDKDNFPKRNRIVAGLCDATVVVESGPKGGSLITAHLAGDYNREVFAFPGRIDDPQSSGTNYLIKNHKAHLIENIDDFISLMGWEKQSTELKDKPLPKLKGTEKEVYNIVLENGSTEIDLISKKLNIPISDLTPVLLEMEFNEIIRSKPGNRYIVD